MNFLIHIKRYLAGYDFFISYSRADSTEYASKLANLIIENGYTCFLDQWGTEPNKKIPKKLRQKLKQSSIMVLLASKNGCKSNAVEEEIDIFLKTKRAIIPVNLGNIESAIWYHKIVGLAISNEAKNFSYNSISDGLIERIINSLKYTKQSSRIRSSILFALTIIIGTISVLALTYFQKSNLEDNIGEKELLLKQKLINIAEKDSIVKLKNEELKFKTDSIQSIDSILSIATKDIISKQKDILRKTAQITNLNRQAEEFKNRALKSYEYPKFIDCNCIEKQALVVFFEFDRTSLDIKTQNYLKRIIQCLKQTKYYIKL